MGTGLLLEYSFSLMHTPPTPPGSSQCYVRGRERQLMTAVAFLKNGIFAELVLQEISGNCVDTKPRDNLHCQ